MHHLSAVRTAPTAAAGPGVYAALLASAAPPGDLAARRPARVLARRRAGRRRHGARGEPAAQTGADLVVSSPPRAARGSAIPCHLGDRVARRRDLQTDA